MNNKVVNKKKEERKPSFAEMVRLPFLFAIVVPIVSGTLVSVSITGTFNFFGFVLAFITGVSLHITTNVYNDIYDTLQGADNEKSKESEFSGGSGILVEHPDLLSTMFRIARGGIVVGVVSTSLLMFFIDRNLWIPLWIVIGLSIFFSKYYTAKPFQFAYRGLGEIVVWLGFGPLAVLLAGFGQNLGFHPVLLSISPITGLGTLFIVWMGEMVDLPTDVKGGKVGLVARIGFAKSRFGLITIHLLALVNVGLVGLYFLNPGWPLLIVFVPYAVLLPKIWSGMKGMKSYERKIEEISAINFKWYIIFSTLLMTGYGLDLLLEAYL